MTGNDDAFGKLRPETRAARALGHDEPQFRGTIPGLYPAVSYARHGDDPGQRIYARDHNPTGEPAEALLASLEGGSEALLFASGMAAAWAVFDALDPGSRIIAPHSMYFALRQALTELPTRRQIEVSFIDMTDVTQLAQTLQSGRADLVWVETPSNPLGLVTDLERTAELAHQAGAVVVADNTCATPVHCQPLTFGVDLVMHSATKQLNGHGDVLAGALISRDESPLWQRIRADRPSRGAVLGAFESWLLLRGMRTLPIRARHSSATALHLAEMLSQSPAIDEVLYPGLPSHPGHALAARQMSDGFAALLSLRITGGRTCALRVMQHLKLFTVATSLGSVESHVEHRASVEGEASNVPEDLLRLAIGLEHPEDLAADLLQALERTTRLG